MTTRVKDSSSAPLSTVSSRSPGFTLVELLVVVTVVAVLASLFISSLSRAKSAAKSVVCKNNLRQQGLGLAMYVNDCHRYPLSQDARLRSEEAWAGPQLVSLGSWAKVLKPYVASPGNVTSVGKYALAHRAFLCPEQERISVPVGNGLGSADVRVASFNGFYGYNGYGTAIAHPQLNIGLGRSWDPLTPELGEEVRESAVQQPSEMVAIADSSGTNSLISPVVLVSALNQWRVFFPGKRHSRAANVAFCDGHVEFLRQSQLIVKDPQVRRRWNNDFEPHPETW